MNMFPIFKIGLFNAWILMLIALLPEIIVMIIDSMKGKGELFMKKMGEAPTEKHEKINNTITSVGYYLLLASTLFIPLKMGTLWFYFGLLVWISGLLIFISAIVTVVKTPPGQVFTRGIYRYSRHPLYLAMFLIFMGIGIASANWIYILISLIYCALQNSNASIEEQKCVKNFGDAYINYLKKTPRWLGIPKNL